MAGRDDIIWDDEIIWDDASPRTMPQELARQAGRTVRQVAEGGAGIAAPFANALGGAYNLTRNIPGMPWASPVAGQRAGTDAVGAVSSLLDRLGIAKDEGAIEELTGAVGRGAVSAGTGIGLAGKAPGVAAQVMASNPAQQLVAATMGTGASEGVRQAGGGAVPQLAAGLLGAATPNALQFAGASGLRGLVRGNEAGRSAFNQRYQDFRNAGVNNVSVGQAAGNRRMQAFESAMSRTPGGAGDMAKFAQQGADDMAARVTRIADDLMPGANSTRAGMAVEKGLRNFVTRFKGEQNVLYGRLDAYIPKDAAVSVSRTKQALASLNADIPNAPALSKWFKNAKIQGIERALLKDAPDDATLPYEAIKKLRTLVGNEITNTNLASTVPKDKWKALYAALSDDMGTAAHRAGPEAQRAWTRANTYTRAGYERIESVLDKVSGKDTAEKIFQAVINPSEIREGATVVNGVMRSLEPAERKVVQAAFIKRMGHAVPNVQNEAGDVFSSQTFLTNWNKVSPEARRVLFPDTRTREGLDALAVASERIRQGSQVFANPSGTAQAGANLVATGGFMGALLTGQVGAAGAIAAGVGSAKASAKLLTNQDFVRWAGKATQMPPGRLPAMLTVLGHQAKNWTAEDRAAAQEFIGAMTGQ